MADKDEFDFGRMSPDKYIAKRLVSIERILDELSKFIRRGDVEVSTKDINDMGRGDY